MLQFHQHRIDVSFYHCNACCAKQVILLYDVRLYIYKPLASIPIAIYIEHPLKLGSLCTSKFSSLPTIDFLLSLAFMHVTQSFKFLCDNETLFKFSRVSSMDYVNSLFKIVFTKITFFFKLLYNHVPLSLVYFSKFLLIQANHLPS